MLSIAIGPPTSTPYHVQTSQGVTLASFKTKAMAESYRKSALLAVALDLQLPLQSRSIPTADMPYELAEAVYQLVRQVARIADVLEEVHK